MSEWLEQKPKRTACQNAWQVVQKLPGPLHRLLRSRKGNHGWKRKVSLTQ